jgi:Response regulators consisting of a CheY-like receiver domain and a winged-helix DNA-binding domain
VQKRILIVDDEPAIRDMVAFALRKGEYEPVHAGDAREAQTAIADRIPDLILLDWMLPGASGLELARRWRKDGLTRDIPIIMLTARGEEDDRVGGLEAGVDDYMVKPFSARELLARIRAVMRRSREDDDEGSITVGGLRIDGAAHRVFAQDGDAQSPIAIGPSRPSSIRNMTISFPAVLNSPVIPVDRPAVPNAEVASNSTGPSSKSETASRARVPPTTAATPSRATESACRMASFEMPRLPIVTWTFPRNSAQITKASSTNVPTLIPPAVPALPPPMNIMIPSRNSVSWVAWL